MYYYLLENFIPVQSLHAKNPGELHNADIAFSVIRERLTLEQYTMAQELFEQAKKGETSISQDKLKYTLGMEIAFGIMVEAQRHKVDVKQQRTNKSQQTRTRTADEYVYRDQPTIANRTPEEERQRDLDLNVRDIMLGNKGRSIAQTPQELVIQMRKAMSMKNYAGVEKMMKAVEHKLPCQLGELSEQEVADAR